jgi:predicted metal-dependent phosphoesterase TrpH
MTVTEYLEDLARLEVKAACITNHGEMGDFEEMCALAPAGLLVIPGVEVSSPEGDFLIFSADYDYLKALWAGQPLPAPDERPPETAVVWAHPFAGVRHGRGTPDSFIASLAGRVDGIEVYNGNWPDDAASERARQIAADYGLAELGGSDAHRRENLYRCWTETAEVNCARDLVRTIHLKETSARKA